MNPCADLLADHPELGVTIAELNQMLDKVKKQVFLNRNNAAFLGSVMCSVEFYWSFENETAWTDGIRLGWNPKDFLRCSEGERKATLLHELWHVAMLHQIRRGSRCPDVWNIACDYRINNNLLRDGFEILSNGWWVFDLKIDAGGLKSEEEIYDLLMKNALPKPLKPMGDLKPGGENPNVAGLVAAAIRGIQAAEMAGEAGNLPSNYKAMLNNFLEPVIPWRNVLARWMTDLMDDPEFSWRKRNRRFTEMYMPSSEMPEGRLETLVYFLDVSGSITKKDIIRFNSEVKYVQEVLRPQKLMLIQFDVDITHIREFTENEPFEEVEITGGGGTSLRPVREWIEENKPTAAIVFSDLFCTPMMPLTRDIPMIWAVVNNKHPQVPFGEVIIVKD